MNIGSIMTFCGHTGVRYIRLQRLQPSSSVSQPSLAVGPQSPFDHVTTLQL